MIFVSCRWWTCLFLAHRYWCCYLSVSVSLSVRLCSIHSLHISRNILVACFFVCLVLMTLKRLIWMTPESVCVCVWLFVCVCVSVSELWILSTTKKAINIQLAPTVGHDNFYFNPKSSVAFILTWYYDHIKDTCSLVIACFPSVHLAMWRKTRSVNEWFNASLEWIVSSVITSCLHAALRLGFNTVLTHVI